MSRDDLIEELKKAPSNGEVQIKLIITPDYFERMCNRHPSHTRRQCHVSKSQIVGIVTIPEILITVSP
jgi:hypothetical protein